MKVDFPFSTPEVDFVPEEFVVPSEVDEVEPANKFFGCTCSEACRLDAENKKKEYRIKAAIVKEKWLEAKRRKEKEMKIKK